ncbi:MAG: Rpn family recombination-promoting nuclease/putative transposase, partial [Saprospiraceae bacterium]
MYPIFAFIDSQFLFSSLEARLLRSGQARLLRSGQGWGNLKRNCIKVKFWDTPDISTLKVLQESYMNEQLQEHFSDLVFEVALRDHPTVKADVALLFEHKSAPDRHVLIQVGHYMFAHWVKCLAEKKKLKVIIPVIYYQGKQKWKLAELSTLFKDYPDYIRDFVPK